MARPDNTIDYMDQGAFKGLRALGRGPVIQFLWSYDHGIDIDGVRRLQDNLGRGGLLARLIERSPLPFGRPRWVHEPGPDELHVGAVDITRDELDAWADERAYLPVDPEYGPPWHLGVQRFLDGGAAISLVVSHVVGDALAISEAVADAARGTYRDLGYPPSRTRSRAQAIRTDLSESVRSVPEMVAAIAGATHVALDQKSELAASARSSTAPVIDGDDRPVALPTVTTHIAGSVWDRRAKALGGSSNTLFAAFCARVGRQLGRVDDDNRAMLSFPVSARTDGDTRGNALATITVMADPDPLPTDLRPLRGDIKRELAGVDSWFSKMTAPLALVPLAPRFAVRRMEKAVLKVGKPIGCSNIGELPAAVNRPDGTDADRLSIRMIEPGLTSADLERMEGHLFIVCSRTARFVSVTSTAWTPGESDNRAALTEAVRKALADFDLVAD